MYAGEELTRVEWFRVLDDLAAVSTFSVCFSGGEALEHPNLVELAERARSLGMAVSVKTGGNRLPEYVDRLADAGVGIVEISMHGATAEVHDAITGTPGSFDRLVAGAAAARARGMRIHLGFLVQRSNVHETEAVRELARRLDGTVQRDYFLTCSDLGRSFTGLFLSPRQIRDIEKSWPLYARPENQNGPEGIRVCAQGMNTVAVTACGEILSCSTLRLPLGSVRLEGLAAVWRAVAGNPGRAHGLDHSLFHRCRDCFLLPRCYICVGQNQAATGRLHEPPLERCLVTMALHGNTRGWEERDASLS